MVTQTGGVTAAYAALAVGFFNSIMFPTIFTLTLERSTASASATSGLLVFGIIGGAISLGISGFIPKSTPKVELARLLRGILEGEVCLPTRFRDAAAARKAQAETRELVQQLGQFTAQQLRVLDMICRGLQNKHIAYELDISVTTVKVHVSEILRKLGVRSRTEAIIALSKLDFGKHDHAPVTAAPPSHGA